MRNAGHVNHISQFQSYSVQVILDLKQQERVMPVHVDRLRLQLAQSA
jgi:hypothetical protein